MTYFHVCHKKTLGPWLPREKQAAVNRLAEMTKGKSCKAANSMQAA